MRIPWIPLSRSNSNTGESYSSHGIGKKREASRSESDTRSSHWLIDGEEVEFGSDYCELARDSYQKFLFMTSVPCFPAGLGALAFRNQEQNRSIPGVCQLSFTYSELLKSQYVYINSPYFFLLLLSHQRNRQQSFALESK